MRCLGLLNIAGLIPETLRVSRSRSFLYRRSRHLHTRG